MRRVISFLSGMIIGSLVGATLGMLLAPMTGNDLREQLRQRVQSIQLEVEQAAQERRAELEEQLAILRSPRRPEGM